ncbi:3-oxoacyl-[acyl-carrier protein] reductase [Roseovarius lutimaris]|uniref:3-oxoacyl-[acyl-carrier protein] reductase n=1 Tax=Roseovarius lutimaris TaxID=1005928 RepID=A0A1I5GQ41_9RHOB|nr:SDR family oxidoreductase [Roseovarius lutimaris]SFO37681.1 3-oxoacyl-[acyl-carrier protein] reductase [Roseovarius lutimaris]
MTKPLLSYDLKGTRALVTGAASGIGLATAQRLARSGCKVVLNHLPNDPAGPEQAARLIAEGCDVRPLPHTIGDGNEAALAQEAVRLLGGLDLLVNNAGTPGGKRALAPSDLDSVTDAMWHQVMEVNLIGLFRLTRAAAAPLRESGGSVVNLASISALSSRGSSMAYAASKAGIISLTRHLAVALAPSIRINGVAPGAVDSTWEIEWTEEQRQSSIQRTPLGRRCTPEDIAETIVYLGFGAPMITGQTIVIDGGLIL